MTLISFFKKLMNEYEEKKLTNEWFENSSIDFEAETDETLKRLLNSHQLANARDLEHIFTDDFWEIVYEDLKFHSNK